MVYLSRKKFVHCDLAARNILLDAHMKCKVGKEIHIKIFLVRGLVMSDCRFWVDKALGRE